MDGKGYQTGTTSDAVVLSSGRAVAVYGVNMASGGTAGNIVLRNGTSSSGTAVLTITGSISAGTVTHFGGVGITFPSGCFIDVDANVASYSVIYEAI